MAEKRFVFGGGNNSQGRCHDCGVLPGEVHHQRCDVERCPWTFVQRITCDCGECAEHVPYAFLVPFGFEAEEVRAVAIDRTEQALASIDGGWCPP